VVEVLDNEGELMMSAKYDEADNPTLTKDGESRPVETVYDLADRPVIVRQADTGSTTGPRVVAVKYDLNGNVIEATTVA
jgi:YD repeat-containing protein